jgi:hypothetical protein
MTRNFLDGVDTNGGQILAAFLLILIGATFIKLGIDNGSEIVTFALGIMSRSMGGSTARAAVKNGTKPEDEPT